VLLLSIMTGFGIIVVWLLFRNCRGDKLDAERRLSENTEVMFDEVYINNKLRKTQMRETGSFSPNKN
jgi:hypothetical protein